MVASSPMPSRIRRASARTISAKLDAARSLMPVSLEIPADSRASRIAAASNDDNTLSLAPSANCASASDLASPILPSARAQLALDERQLDHLGDEDGPGHQRGEGKTDHHGLDQDVGRQEHRPRRQLAQPGRRRRFPRRRCRRLGRSRGRVGDRRRWRRAELPPMAPEPSRVATAREPAAPQGPHSAARMMAMPAAASPAPTSRRKSLEASELFIFRSSADQIVTHASGQSTAFAECREKTTTRPKWARTRPCRPSMSGDRRSARLECDTRRVRFGEPGVGGQIRECGRMRRQQTRRRRVHHRCWPAPSRRRSRSRRRRGPGHMVGGLRPDRAQDAFACEARSDAPRLRDRETNDVVQSRSLRVHRRGRGLRAAVVEMSERQQKLDRQREQREPRPSGYDRWHIPA